MTRTKAQRIRDLLAGGSTMVMPGVYDALSARLATRAGFEVLFISGYSVSAARLAAPDFGYLTQTEITETAREVTAATPLPVIVDADTGYGNPLSAMRTARLVHAAGGAGIFLEDQEWPKKCGHYEGKRVVPRGEWLAKLQAVIDLRGEGVDLFLVARTDAAAAVGLDEAIRRAKEAKALGVDAVFVEAPRSVEELERVTKEVEDSVRVANMIEGGQDAPALSGGAPRPRLRPDRHAAGRAVRRGPGARGDLRRDAGRGDPPQPDGPPGRLRHLQRHGRPRPPPRPPGPVRGRLAPLRIPEPGIAPGRTPMSSM